MEQEQIKAIDCWAIVELFGHNKIAGRLTTQTVGMAAMFRVDVPEIVIPEQREEGRDYVGGKYVRVERVSAEHKVGGYTRFFGVGAIYAISPVTEETVRAAVVEIEPRPIRPLVIPIEKILPESTTEVDEDEGEEAPLCPECGGNLDATEAAGVSSCANCGVTIPMGKLNG